MHNFTALCTTVFLLFMKNLKGGGRISAPVGVRVNLSSWDRHVPSRKQFLVWNISMRLLWHEGKSVNIADAQNNRISFLFLLQGFASRCAPSLNDLAVFWGNITLWLINLVLDIASRMQYCTWEQVKFFFLFSHHIVVVGCSVLLMFMLW